ncbi:asparaginase [[Limnothrix rosea] IAM M-220]|uniref:asparaginase n=1 Tax=[Limnothrix rosea] IAM M-220 TaxID=454133 RepID=UPI00095FBBE5|nr:asparaginase [[Limnothrix rosea] IAM M-220]OKH15215.1 asparaginase [[Limnothrix rosea] IAM M-220]
MSRGNRIKSPKLEISLLREGLKESTHLAEAVVCDTKGRVLSVAGDGESSAFIRSALKPFQALAVVGTGSIEHYKLTDKDLAVICSSHKGTKEHARQVFRILWQADLESQVLQCPIPHGKDSALEHNCSGKHAGMLLTCKHCNWSLSSYMEKNHPVQELILNKVAELLKMPPQEFIAAKDDCGVPTYLMQLRQMATLYAHLASGDRLDVERVVRAMTYHPTMVAGKGGFDTELMRLSEGEIVSKSGAEGIQCIGRVGEGLGLAIKVQDGAKRAKYAVALYLLTRLGWISPAVSDTLSEQFLSLSPYKRLDVVGELALV